MKNQNYINYIFIFGLLVLILGYICTYTININEKAINSKFGEISLVEEVGLHFKLPRPLQKITYLDMRRQILEGKLTETRLIFNSKQKTQKSNINLMIKIFANWQIAKGKEIIFYEKLNSLQEAENQLNIILASTQKQIFQLYSFNDLFNISQKSKIDKIEKEICNESNQKASRYGLKIHYVGISQINFLEKDSGNILKRMSTEQNLIANEIKIFGESKINKIKTQANAFKEKTLAEAHRKAAALRNEATIESLKFYSNYKNLDEDFAIFLRQLDTLEKILKRNPTLILDSNIAPFSLLKSK